MGSGWLADRGTGSLGIEDNKDIVRRQFERISAGAEDGAAMLYAPVSRNHGREVDRDTLRGVFRSLIALREQFAVLEVVAEGDWVACRATVTGQHRAHPELPVDSGIRGMLPPTGRPYTVLHMHLFRLAQGEIVEHWANRDDLGAARQLGPELRPEETAGGTDSARTASWAGPRESGPPVGNL